MTIEELTADATGETEDTLPESELDPKALRRRRRKRRLRFVAGTLAMALGGIALAYVIPVIVTGPIEQHPEVRTLEDVSQEALLLAVKGTKAEMPPEGVLRVASLNLAHGRANGFHQLVTSRQRIKRNLGEAGALIRREQAQVVAVQEADGPSVWSGQMDHVAYLSAAAKLSFFARASHVKGLGLDYGTAIAATLPLEGCEGFGFGATPPTFPKGYLIATVAWPGRETQTVDVVSVHLDFARTKARSRQVEAMIERLQHRPGDRPLVVIGDFNCEWNDADSAVKRLAEALSLHTHEPEAPLVTFPLSKRRLDWILISESLGFARHEVLEDVVSDHKAVIADLVLKADASAER